MFEFSAQTFFEFKFGKKIEFFEFKCLAQSIYEFEFKFSAQNIYEFKFEFSAQTFFEFKFEFGKKIEFKFEFSIFIFASSSSSPAKIYQVPSS